MRCPACGGETPDGKRFCANCGKSLAMSCMSCGAQLVPGKPFCADCGTPVSASFAPGSSSEASGGTAQSLLSAPIAERRLCSVLFVDMVGFTSFAEKRDFWRSSPHRRPHQPRAIGNQLATYCT
ncbi:MAG: double zinc ribbon domain-containing protein [Acidimicrobiales bacterium]